MNDRPAGQEKSLLVLGGARSGKSAYAQAVVEAAVSDGREAVYIATAQAWDDEMKARIATHVAMRDGRWRTVESPYDLAETLAAEAVPGRVVLVDCLTLWLTNIMLRGDDVDVATAALAARVSSLNGGVVLVSNEVGSGIVPDNPLGRRFRDAQGRLNQAIAQACGGVVLVVAGLPLVLKPAAPPPPLL